ncbi:MAG TPA: glycine cleavage system protein H [Parasulfuritortus sp.]
MKETFRGRIPVGLLYDPRHDMWLRREGDEVVIGATAFGLFLAGEIIGFTAKPRGAVVEDGRGLGTVECAKTVLAVHAPIGFELIEINEAAEDRPAIINRDPYGDGWLVRGRPLDWRRDAGHLVDAHIYRGHVMHVEPDAEPT